MNTKFGYQFLGKPPESFRAKCGGSKGIKIVGDETDLTQLRDWNVEIKQARLITEEKRIEAARDRNNLAEIPALAAETAERYAAVDARLGVAGVWYEIGPIMPAVTPWTSRWFAAAASAFQRKGLRSVLWGFATGTPQVAPWANAANPDEWPGMYDCLRVMHSLGPDWVRLGVEEYITGGLLIPGDWSNAGRIREVYERHIRPNGWNIVFRGIEAGYDVPGMLDAGIIPANVMTGNKRGELGLPDGGLAQADARYASLPCVDCMFLYQVSDPVVFTDEAKFAFTPGDRHAPVGFLETMQGYFAAHPPAPFVAPKPTTPAPDPEPEPIPEPEPAPVNLLVNPSFEGGHSFDLDDRFGDRKVPTGWQIGWNSKQAAPHIELDQHPPRVTDGVTALRIWADKRFQAWAYQRVAVEVGAQYELSASGIGHREYLPLGRVQVDIAVDTKGGDNYVNADNKTGNTSEEERREMLIRFTATQPEITVFGEVHTGSDGRGDGWLDGFKLVKVKESAPNPKPDPAFPAWYRVNTGTDRLRKRLAPSLSGEIVELQASGSEILVESIADGWAKEKGAGLYASAQYLVKK